MNTFLLKKYLFLIAFFCLIVHNLAAAESKENLIKGVVKHNLSQITNSDQQKSTDFTNLFQGEMEKLIANFDNQKLDLKDALLYYKFLLNDIGLNDEKNKKFFQIILSALIDYDNNFDKKLYALSRQEFIDIVNAYVVPNIFSSYDLINLSEQEVQILIDEKFTQLVEKSVNRDLIVTTSNIKF
ncbi:MAG: hypothetical protein H6553_09935 [Chitinophagales bacterium]|nr:hypothetical protein [Chitinophagales bacterium]